MSMIARTEVLEMVENYIPDMLQDIDETTSEHYERFVNTVRYLCQKDIGIKPKFHKGKSIHDYWTCGNCGHIVDAVTETYCGACGFRMINKDYKEEETE